MISNSSGICSIQTFTGITGSYASILLPLHARLNNFNIIIFTYNFLSTPYHISGKLVFPISYRYCKSHKYAVSGKHLKCKFSYDSKYVSKQLMQVGKLAWHSLYAMQELMARFPGSLYEHFLYTRRGVI